MNENLWAKFIGFFSSKDFFQEVVDLVLEEEQIGPPFSGRGL